MCTILTVSSELYRINPESYRQRILMDSRLNSDGGSLVFLDPEHPDRNTIFRSMNSQNLIALLGLLMRDASSQARVFIHMRAATTHRTGVAFTHAFENQEGLIYMHNGVIANRDHRAVDSFNLAHIGKRPSTEEIYQYLSSRNERFANVFVIDTENYSYGVIRMQTGSLYTDDLGNYSTAPVQDIRHPARRDSWAEYSLVLIAAPLAEPMEAIWLPRELRPLGPVQQIENPSTIVVPGRPFRRNGTN